MPGLFLSFAVFGSVVGNLRLVRRAAPSALAQRNDLPTAWHRLGDFETGFNNDGFARLLDELCSETPSRGRGTQTRMRSEKG